MDGCTSPSSRAFLRFLFALLSFLFPVALGLGLDPDVLLTVAFDAPRGIFVPWLPRYHWEFRQLVAMLPEEMLC